ncbi:DNA helicase [Tanacetum coccineum]
MPMLMACLHNQGSDFEWENLPSVIVQADPIKIHCDDLWGGELAVGVILYADFINPIEALEIQRQPCATDEEEQMRNRYSIQSLLNVNPQHYQRVRFTTKATIIQVSAARGWYYKKCIACNMKVIGESSNLQCADHGPQPTANYG